MSNRIKVIGFPDSDLVQLLPLICNCLLELGIAYPITAFEVSNDQVVGLNTNTAEESDIAVTRAIDLPPLKAFLSKWQTLTVALSTHVSDTLISILAGGVVEVALNGKLL